MFELNHKMTSVPLALRKACQYTIRYKNRDLAAVALQSSWQKARKVSDFATILGSCQRLGWAFVGGEKQNIGDK